MREVDGGFFTDELIFYRAVKKNKTWENLRRAYGFCMTQNMKSLLKANEGILLGPEAEKKYGPFEKEKIFSATTLMQFDDAYSRKMAGYSNILDYYANASCSNVIDKVILLKVTSKCVPFSK